jgi:predicted  nucleic acid-binding Zn-ribbon protein
MDNKEEELERLKLKVMALRERVANITAEQEDKVADLRVELTLVSQERDSLREQLNAPASTEED